MPQTICVPATGNELSDILKSNQSRESIPKTISNSKVTSFQVSTSGTISSCKLCITSWLIIETESLGMIGNVALTEIWLYIICGSGLNSFYMAVASSVGIGLAHDL